MLGRSRGRLVTAAHTAVLLSFVVACGSKHAAADDADGTGGSGNGEVPLSLATMLMLQGQYDLLSFQQDLSGCGAGVDVLASKEPRFVLLGEMASFGNVLTLWSCTDDTDCADLTGFIPEPEDPGYFANFTREAPEMLIKGGSFW